MAKYISHSRLASLETEGIYLAESMKFKGVMYKPDGQGISIYAGESGAIAFRWDRLDDLIEELMSFQEVYDEANNSGRTG